MSAFQGGKEGGPFGPPLFMGGLETPPSIQDPFNERWTGVERSRGGAS